MYFLKKHRRGIFNRYRKNMPVIEMMLKDFGHLLSATNSYIKNNFKHKPLLVHPHYPSRGATLYKISRLLRLTITNKPSPKIPLAVYWEYLTFRKEHQLLDAFSQKNRVINLHSRDISKVYVDAVFKKVFNYSTIVDPLTYTGKIVKKNDINAKHDGSVLDAPLRSVEEGYIYQLLIDNSYEDDLVMDIRVPVVGRMLDFVYIKYRHISERFKNTTIKTDIKPTNEVFADEEIALLNRYCMEMQLDYGELDVLRDNLNNKIYVVDVNNTPQGPPANISKEHAQYALKEIARNFEKAFISPTCYQ